MLPPVSLVRLRGDDGGSKEQAETDGDDSRSRSNDRGWLQLHANCVTDNIVYVRRMLLAWLDGWLARLQLMLLSHHHCCCRALEPNGYLLISK